MKKRPYRLGKRAEARDSTRRRIVEAAIDLHTRVGPARTTIAQIADRAGVQRHTFYAHFPDERSLLQACSGLAMERDPLPDVESWLAVSPGPERARRALDQLYEWYDRNRELVASVLRDAEVHDATRETVETRWAPTFERAGEIVAETLGEQSLVLARLAVDFACWRVLRTVHSSSEAASIMSDAIAAASAR